MIKKLLSVCGAAALALSLASCTSEQDAEPEQEAAAPAQEETTDEETDDTTSNRDKAEAVGINEIPIGDSGPQDAGPLTVDLVYFQAIDMEQGSVAVPPASESDMHFEIDIATNETALEVGYEADQFLPYLDPEVKIVNKDTGEEIDPGTMMPMIASDGPHYGNNISLEPGNYEVFIRIASPGDKFMLHTGHDSSGVEGRFWEEPLEFHFDNWQWDGQLL